MVFTHGIHGIHGIDNTDGIDLDSSIELVLLNHTRTRGPSVAQMQYFSLQSIICNIRLCVSVFVLHTSRR